MFSIFETAVAMSCFPFMNKNFGILGFVSERTCETAVVLVGMREHNALNIRNPKTHRSQAGAQRLDCFFGFRTSVDNCDGVLGDEVDIDRTDVERGWE